MIARCRYPLLLPKIRARVRSITLILGETRTPVLSFHRAGVGRKGVAKYLVSTEQIRSALYLRAYLILAKLSLHEDVTSSGCGAPVC